MKLIIDIEKDYYEMLKYNVEHEQNYKPWNIITNGIPYEERPQGEWVKFADYVARNVVNDDFSEDVDFYAEVLCRKLVKLGLVKLDGDTYKYCGADMRGGAE